MKVSEQRSSFCHSLLELSIFSCCVSADCLGYEVPEGKTWVCPRHRCQDCGIIALYSCRFCVTSFCGVSRSIFPVPFVHECLTMSLLLRWYRIIYRRMSKSLAMPQKTSPHQLILCVRGAASKRKMLSSKRRLGPIFTPSSSVDVPVSVDDRYYSRSSIFSSIFAFIYEMLALSKTKYLDFRQCSPFDPVKHGVCLGYSRKLRQDEARIGVIL